MSSLYMSQQRSHGPGPEEDLEIESPPVTLPNHHDVKKDSTHKSNKKYRHSSSGKHRSHHHHGQDKHRSHHHKSSTKKSHRVPEKEGFTSYSPDSPPHSGTSHRDSVKKHRESTPKNKMTKLDSKPTEHRVHKQGGGERYANQVGNSEKRYKNKHVTQSAPPIRGTRESSVSDRREQVSPNTLVPYGTRDLANRGEEAAETSYPGAYWETGASESSDDEESASLSDMENGEAMVTAYVVPNDEAYFPPPPRDVAPRDQVTRSAPPVLPPQTVEAPRQINETKQSLNITVPTAAPTSGGVPVTSSVTRSNNDGCCSHGCVICGAVTFAIIGVGCVALFFIVPVLGIWLIIPGIVFLICSCVFCCCLCRGSNTYVTTFMAST